MRLWVRSLALLRGLRILHCDELWCRLKTWLEPLWLWLWLWLWRRPVATAPIRSLSLGTSICCRCNPKKIKKKKKKDKKKRKEKENQGINRSSFDMSFFSLLATPPWHMKFPGQGSESCRCNLGHGSGNTRSLNPLWLAGIKPASQHSIDGAY